MIRIEIDEDDPLHFQLRAACAQVEREVPGQHVTMDDMLERAMWEGLASISGDLTTTLDHFPNSVFTLHALRQSGDFLEGQEITLGIYSLPVGCEIFRTKVSMQDAPNWDALSITFGTLQVLQDPTPLSVVRCLTYENGLGVFRGVKSKVDIQVCVRLRCKIARHGSVRLFRRRADL